MRYCFIAINKISLLGRLQQHLILGRFNCNIASSCATLYQARAGKVKLPELFGVASGQILLKSLNRHPTKISARLCKERFNPVRRWLQRYQRRLTGEHHLVSRLAYTNLPFLFTQPLVQHFVCLILLCYHSTCVSVSVKVS